MSILSRRKAILAGLLATVVGGVKRVWGSSAASSPLREPACCEAKTRVHSSPEVSVEISTYEECLIPTVYVFGVNRFCHAEIAGVGVAGLAVDPSRQVLEIDLPRQSLRWIVNTIRANTEAVSSRGVRIGFIDPTTGKDEKTHYAIAWDSNPQVISSPDLWSVRVRLHILSSQQVTDDRG